jgi:hypothetical protein
MAAITLGKNPKNFKKSVDIVLLSGKVAPLSITYKYRTRKQFAALVDETVAAGKAAPDADGDAVEQKSPAAAPPSVTELFEMIDKGGVEWVLKIAEGWDLDDEFNEENLLMLEDENPGSLTAIASVYRLAVAEARTKN